MSSRHSVLITAASAGEGVGAGNFTRCEHREQEQEIRLDERRRERARLVLELHDTLLQGFLGASLLLDEALVEIPADSPCHSLLGRAARLVRRAIEEGRAAMQGLQAVPSMSTDLEQALSQFLQDVTPASGVRLRLFVEGRPAVLMPAVQEQLLLIAREAVMNALRHSGAAEIEVVVQYMRTAICVTVRDNGRGMDSELAQKQIESHWGLRGMRERAESIGAQFAAWSRRGAGTEAVVTVPLQVASPAGAQG